MEAEASLRFPAAELYFGNTPWKNSGHIIAAECATYFQGRRSSSWRYQSTCRLNKGLGGSESAPWNKTALVVFHRLRFKKKFTGLHEHQWIETYAVNWEEWCDINRRRCAEILKFWKSEILGIQLWMLWQTALYIKSWLMSLHTKPSMWKIGNFLKYPMRGLSKLTVVDCHALCLIWKEGRN